MTPEFGKIASQAMRGGVDVSMKELVLALDYPLEDVLGSAMQVGSIIESMGLTLDPDFTRGDYDTRRALRENAGVPSIDIASLVAEEESGASEFKSTLLCDLRAFRESPERLVRSDGVTHSALKTICAFANSGGGRLLIGVENDHTVCGLAPDMRVLNADRDQWELHLRNLIQGRFWQGRLVNCFVDVRYLPVEGVEVALIEVVGRKESTFLKDLNGARHEFFVRQGNRTVSLDIQEFELYLQGR